MMAAAAPDFTTLVERRWAPMLQDPEDSGCLWETFLGDDIDSRCHPWSGAPAALVWDLLLGVSNPPEHPEVFLVRPAVDQLERAAGRVHSAAGWVDVSWEHVDGRPVVKAEASEGCEVEVYVRSSRDA